MKEKCACALACSVLGLVACSSDSSGGAKGTLQIIVVPEDTIPDGLTPGTGEENVKDGWTITYDRFLTTVGDFKATRSDAAGEALAEPTVFVLDLKNAPQSGYVLAEIKDAAAVRWDKFGFDMPNAKAGAKAGGSTSAADLDFMVKSGFATYFDGKATNGPDTITFKWGFKTGTSFADCANAGGAPGFAIPAGGSVQVKPTIHGDHFFFTNVTQGAELTERRAQWMKTCDKDGNKELTLDELKQCDVVTALPQKPTGPYDLTGVKDQDGDGKLTVYDYVDTQLRTLGDFQGDGECPTRRPLP